MKIQKEKNFEISKFKKKIKTNEKIKKKTF